MKKILAALLVTVMLLSSVACSAKTETASFKLEQNGVSSLLTYTYEGDKVLTQTAKNVINYEGAMLGDKDSAMEMLQPMAEMYQNVKGIEHNVEYGDTEAVETLKITYADLDIEKFSELPGILSSGDVSKGISFKESEKMLLNSGFEKVE